MLTTTLFAPRDTEAYPPCGMFTATHFFALFVTLVCVGIGLYLCRKITLDKLKFATKIVAICVTVLECIKIGYNFAYDYTWLDAWIPLAFCSIFIYASWMAGFGKGTLEKFGDAFLLGGCPIAGFAFLLFPTTSLQLHPIYHFLCIHSMLFHGAMLWLGLLYLFRGKDIPDLKTFRNYARCFTLFAIPALILNATTGSNMMFLRQPFNMPIQLLNKLYDASQILYTVLIFCVYLACYLGSVGIYKLVTYIKIKKESTEQVSATT